MYIYRIHGKHAMPAETFQHKRGDAGCDVERS